VLIAVAIVLLNILTLVESPAQYSVVEAKMPLSML
jgi:hypothetical protein